MLKFNYLLCIILFASFAYIYNRTFYHGLVLMEGLTDACKDCNKKNVNLSLTTLMSKINLLDSKFDNKIDKIDSNISDISTKVNNNTRSINSNTKMINNNTTFITKFKNGVNKMGDEVQKQMTKAKK